MQERNSQRPNPGFVFQFKMLKFLYLFTCLIMKFKGLQSQEIRTIIKETFCYNSPREGFRLNATVLEVRNVPSRSACIDECFADPCCRSMNYEYSTSPNYIPNKCEFLHDLMEENTSFVLEANTSFDHIFFISPQKEYSSNCFRKKTYVSCKEVLEKNSAAANGVYSLQLNKTSGSEIYPVYCHMSNISSKCGGGGWTLVMKLDRDKQTFEYDSPLWTNNETFNVQDGLNVVTESETKLASYHNTPFTKICLGMKVNSDTNWILVNQTASSLYSVIANGSYIATNVGRAEWLSLIDGSKLQKHCNMEGFNLKLNTRLYLRIGLAGNNEDDCKTPDSVIGFGIERSNRQSVWKLSSGENTFSSQLKAFGYILVQ